MSQVTVKQLADVLAIPVDKLLQQLQSAGVDISDPDARVSNADKKTLLNYLRTSHGKGGATESEGGTRVALRRRQVSEITVPGGSRSGGRGAPAKKVNVEVRGRRKIQKPGADAGDADREREDARRALEEIHQERAREEQQRLEAEERARQQAEERERQQAEERERQEHERKQREAEVEAQREAQEQQQREVEAQAREQAELERAQPEAKTAKPKREKKPKKPETGDRTRYGREQLHVATPSSRRRKQKPRRSRVATPSTEHGFQKPAAPVKRHIEVPETITVGELAKLMAVKGTELVKVLMNMGTMVTINQSLDQDTAILVAEEMGHEASPAEDKDIEAELVAAEEEHGETAEQVTRSPVVTVMGHVDHGKTSLLDHIREARVAAGEAGGITQHIGAYHVETRSGGVTFLDTPGHAAFTSMRARGADVTDLVILVVAADDGVKPQTREAIQHARAADVPLIVAVNKCDLDDADPERVRNELSQEEVIPEQWGGNEIFVDVSAKTGAGIDEMLEAIVLQAELLELKADPGRRARGVVVESRLERGRGPVATILVQDGTLHQGDMLLAGEEFGRVRAMFNELGEAVDDVGPSMPAEILGLSGVPGAGDDVVVVADERKVRDAAEQRKAKRREGRLAHQQAANLQNLFDQMGRDGEQQTVNLVIKADVQGSAEALVDALTRLSSEEIKINVVASGVGAITESDATLAQASQAIVIGFNVRADAAARKVIQEADLDLHYYSVIYDAIDQVKKAITGLLGTETKEEIVGLAEVRDVFRSARFGAVAGCLVIEGVVRRHNPIRVLRDNVVIYEGELESLRRFKDDVKEVQAGTECGIGVKQYNDIRAGDQVECFERVEVAREL